MRNLIRKTFKKFISISLGLSIALSSGIGIIPSTVQTASAATLATGSKIIATGNHYLGTPYQYGAKAGNTSRFDCSSFTQYVYKRNGISLPRGARGQALRGHYVPKNKLKKGDLVFFSTKATMKYSRSSLKRIGHVGIYAGNGKILHTYGKGGVKYSSLYSKWWRSHYVTARRVL